MSEPREELARALSTYLTPEQVTKLIDEILSINKRASAEFKCKKCEQRQMAWTTIPDARAVTTALTDLMSQAFGRPQEASTQNDPILFYRLTNMEELHAVRHLEESRGGLNGEHGENGEVREQPDEGEGLLEAESDPDLQVLDPEVPNTLRRCRACGELKPKVAFMPIRRGAQICVECRA